MSRCRVIYLLFCLALTGSALENPVPDAHQTQNRCIPFDSIHCIVTRIVLFNPGADDSLVTMNIRMDGVNAMVTIGSVEQLTSRQLVLHSGDSIVLYNMQISSEHPLRYKAEAVRKRNKTWRLP